MSTAADNATFPKLFLLLLLAFFAQEDSDAFCGFLRLVLVVETACDGTSGWISTSKGWFFLKCSANSRLNRSTLVTYHKLLRQEEVLSVFLTFLLKYSKYRTAFSRILQKMTFGWHLRRGKWPFLRTYVALSCFGFESGTHLAMSATALLRRVL